MGIKCVDKTGGVVRHLWAFLLVISCITPGAGVALGDEIGVMRGWWGEQALSSSSWGRSESLETDDSALLSELHHLVWTDDFSGLRKFARQRSLSLLINQPSASGQFAILLAQSPEMLQLLLNQGADPLLANQFGDTLLLLMVQRDQLQMVKLLLKYGANPNQANNYAETALTESSWRKQQTIYELLQSYGHR